MIEITRETMSSIFTRADLNKNKKIDNDEVAEAEKNNGITHEEAALLTSMNNYYHDEQHDMDETDIQDVVAISPEGLATEELEAEMVSDYKRYLVHTIRTIQWDISNVSAAIRDDKDVAMVAIEVNPSAFDRVSARLRADNEVIEKARASGYHFPPPPRVPGPYEESKVLFQIGVGPLYYLNDSFHKSIGVNLLTFFDTQSIVAVTRNPVVVKIPQSTLDAAQTKLQGYEDATEVSPNNWVDSGHVDGSISGLNLGDLGNDPGSSNYVREGSTSHQTLEWLGIFSKYKNIDFTRRLNLGDYSYYEQTGIGTTSKYRIQSNHSVWHKSCWGGPGGYDYNLYATVTATDPDRKAFNIDLLTIRYGIYKYDDGDYAPGWCAVGAGLFFRSHYLEETMKTKVTLDVNELYYNHSYFGPMDLAMANRNSYTFDVGLRARALELDFGTYLEALIFKVPVRFNLGAAYQYLNYDNMENCSVNYKHNNWSGAVGISSNLEVFVHLKDLL